jgi:hypothetical protein
MQMVCVQKIIFSLFVWSSQAMGCSDRFAIIEIGSPAKRQAEIINAFADTYRQYPVEWASPQEIIDRGCQPDAYFKECVLKFDGDKMAAAWLRNFFNDREVAQRVSQESLDVMLAYAAEMPSASPALIEQLLSYGADPCAGINACTGIKPPVEVIFKQLTAQDVDMHTVSEKLYLMVDAMRKDPRSIQYAHESLADAGIRFMAAVARRADCKDDLKVKFGRIGEGQSDEACAQYCQVWTKICALLSERKLRGSGDVSTSPFRRKKTAFEKFATRCVDACIAQNESV